MMVNVNVKFFARFNTIGYRDLNTVADVCSLKQPTLFICSFCRQTPERSKGRLGQYKKQGP
jgi:hypothetical protein